MKLTKIKLQASGFEPKYFDTRNWQINQLLYELSLGNTCLVLPEHADLDDAKGVYIHQRASQFELVTGNSSMRMPHVYENNRSLWVPKDFIVTAASRCTIQQTEKLPMDLVSLVMADQLFAVTVVFQSGGQRYTYKSQNEIAVGAKVVVDSPSNGFVVVTVVACSKGLDTTTDKFASYKWVVDVVDVAEYERLKTVEADMVQKAKAKKRLDEAKKQLEDLGFTTEELIAMVKGND